MNEELYFKDAFTEVDGSINLEVNNLKTNCITSNNNKFSLDSEGNLIVNSITTKQSNDSNINFDMIYPEGSIYFSINRANPSTLFGGVWEAIAQGRTLIGAGSDIKNNNNNWAGELNNSGYNFECGEMGGQFKHKLTVDEMPRHSHEQNVTNSSSNYSNYYNMDYTTYGTGYTAVQGCPTKETGNDLSHNSIPPYLVVYIWQRIS